MGTRACSNISAWLESVVCNHNNHIQSHAYLARTPTTTQGKYACACDRSLHPRDRCQHGRVDATHTNTYVAKHPHQSDCCLWTNVCVCVYGLCGLITLNISDCLAFDDRFDVVLVIYVGVVDRPHPVPTVGKRTPDHNYVYTVCDATDLPICGLQ